MDVVVGVATVVVLFGKLDVGWCDYYYFAFIFGCYCMFSRVIVVFMIIIGDIFRS